jgi:hypothetical protein
MAYPWGLFLAIEVPVIAAVISIIVYVRKHPKL